MTEIDTFPVENPRRFQFNWLLPVFWKPKKILNQVVEQTRGTWLTPLLVLTVVAILAVVISGPIRLAAAQSVPQETPPDFEYWSPEQQEQFFAAQATSVGPVYTYVLPALSALVRIWLGWLVLSAVLHLVLTLAGGRTNMTTVLNIVAWASVPILIRNLVQIGSLLITRQGITAPGLSGFSPQTGTSVSFFLTALLALIDFYLIWQVILIIVGLKSVPGMTSGRAISGAIIAMVITLVLMALPGFAGSQLGGLLTSQPMYFF